MVKNSKIKLPSKMYVQSLISKLKHHIIEEAGTGVKLPNVFPRDFQFRVISLESGRKC